MFSTQAVSSQGLNRGRATHTHRPCEVLVHQGHSFGSTCRSTGVQDQSNVFRLCLLDRLAAVAFQFALVLDVQHDLFAIPVAFGNSRSVLSRSLDSRTVGLALRHKNQCRAQIINVKLKFRLLVSRVEWSGNCSLP